MAKAKLSNLKRGTHKGRPSKTTPSGADNHKWPNGLRATGLTADPRLTAAAMTRITPTPSGPEPGHGGTEY